MWCFDHKNQFNQYQMAFNERQQKINRMHFNAFDYNAIMLGSSRTAFINHNDIKTYHAYNMAVERMHPSEFSDYLEHAKKVNKKDFDIVFLGLDFSSATHRIEEEQINEYISNVNAFAYRYKILFSLDTLRYSIKNVSNFLFDKYKTRSRTFDRDFISHSYPQSPQSVKNSVDEALFDYEYPYDENYKKTLQELKDKNPNTRFYVFTTPLPSKYLRHLLSNPHNRQYYTRWLKENVEVFHEIEHFMTLNSVTEDYAHTFNGASHFYPSIGTHIVNKTFSYPDDTYKDFGIKLDEGNLQQELNTVFKSVKE